MATNADRVGHTGLGVLVGVDGSDHSIAAARWAAREASTRQVPLTLCRVVQAVPDGSEYDRQIHVCRRDLDRARAHLGTLAGLDVRELVATGPASRELIRLAADADLIVVGARGRGGFAGLLLGSVADQVATHAPVAAVVVREPPERFESAPIFVGVDDAPGTRPAIEYAFSAAARDGDPLVALHAYPELVSMPELGYLPVSPHTHMRDRATAFVDRLLEPCRQAYPDVTVTVEVVTRPAGSTLCEASHDAHLVVVGAAGRAILAGLLGSVTRKVLHHAECPVVVAR